MRLVDGIVPTPYGLTDGAATARVYMWSMNTDDDRTRATGDSTIELAERKAIVTGGASGIGKATAVALARAGAEVVVTDIDEAGGASVADEVGGTFAMLDVSDPASWDRVVGTIGPFGIAFLNAGISTYQGLAPADVNPIVALTDEAYHRIMSINLDGVVFGARAVLPGMIARGSGDIVATASLAGVHPISMDPIYGLTKHGVVGLVRSLAEHFASTPDSPDICVSALCPAFTDTNIVSDDMRALLGEFEIEIMPVERVVEVVMRMLAERKQGAQWLVEPGAEPYTWNWDTPKTFGHDD